MGPKPKPILERVWPKVEKTDGCWIWMGSRTSFGYGRMYVAPGRSEAVYRVVYREMVGDIPDGTHLDHLCRTPSCVRPDHLEPVSPRENVLRGVSPTVLLHNAGACKRGHPVTEGSVQRKPGGRIAYCRVCKQERSADYYVRVEKEARRRRAAKRVGL